MPTRAVLIAHSYEPPDIPEMILPTTRVSLEFSEIDLPRFNLKEERRQQCSD
jgi:hypothetical protein